MIHHRRTVLRAVRASLVLLVAATLVGGAGTVDAQEASPGLGGYQGSAAASGLHALYAPEGLLPTAPPLDLGAPDALATIATGPSTFARAGVADPGDLLANPDALLQQADPSWEAGTLPEWPLRISSNSATGEPVAESTPAPGLHARTEARESSSTARATMPALGAPAVATVGSLSSVATTETDGSTVTVHARSEASEIDVLGLITIESVVTDLIAVSDGTETTYAGGTTVTGMTVAGQEATIDADGIHVAPDQGGSGGLLGDILGTVTTTANELIEQLGIRITLAEPLQLSGGGEVQFASAGLRIDLEFSERTMPALGEILDVLPPIENPIPGAPAGIEDIIAAVRARHLFTIQIGRGVVSLAATPGFEFTPPPVSTTPTTGVAPVAGTPSGTATTSGGSAVTPTGTPDTTTTAAPDRASTPASSEVPVGAGIAGFVILALLSQPILGGRIAAGAAAVLADPNSIPCALEDR